MTTEKKTQLHAVTRTACAKINLTLDVTGKQPDNYHTVRMVMQSLCLRDNVLVSLDDSGGYTMPSLPFLPADDSNLALRAAKAFYAYTGLPNPGTHIELTKHIPLASGLAGGSSDAAATLCALDSLHQTALSDVQLCEIGLTLGADVPFCLLGGTQLAEGIGERLTPLPSMPRCFIVLCKPPFDVSTAAVYARMDTLAPARHPDTEAMLAALQNSDYPAICHALYNVMEPVVSAIHPEIDQIKGALLNCGADGAAMSGSGPTVFGLFSDQTRAEAAFFALHAQYAHTFLTMPVESRKLRFWEPPQT